MKLLKKHLSLIIFVFIEAVLYASFLYFDFVNFEVSKYLKYTSILLALLASSFLVVKKRSICSVFTVIAMIFTVISDYFLLLSNDSNLFGVGVMTFFITQIFYAFTLHKRNNFEAIKIDLSLRIALTILVIIICTAIKVDALTTCALIYFIELFMNFILSILYIKKDKRNFILTIGFFLFILCDINVALNNLNLSNETARFVVNYLMWLFYLPSQVILSTNSYFLES